MKDYIKNNIKDLLALKKEISNLLIDFLKHIVMVSSTLLAVVVALIQPSPDSKFLYLILVLLLLLSILSGSLAFYVAVVQLRKLGKDYAAHIAKSIQNPNFGMKGISSKYNKIALIFEYISLLSFLASVIVLVLYAVS